MSDHGDGGGDDDYDARRNGGGALTISDNHGIAADGGAPVGGGCDLIRHLVVMNSNQESLYDIKKNSSFRLG